MRETYDFLKTVKKWKEMTIEVKVLTDPENGNRAFQCPSCKKMFDRYLLAVDGLIGCRKCMERTPGGLKLMIAEGLLDVVIDGVKKTLNERLARRIGLI